MTRDLVYGRNAARELYRGPRDVLEVWVTERAVAQIPWLDSGPRPQVKPERVLSEAAGTRDHQGVVAWCEPFRYADAYELAAAERPLLVCLDQVTDPHNLGAVIRSAEGAGATGIVVPAHGSARVTPAVCRASAGAVEHLPVAVVPNLARYLGDIKGPDLWAYAADAEGAVSMWDADLDGRRRARPRRRGQGSASARPPDVRRHDRDPAGGEGRLAQRLGRGCAPALRGTSPTDGRTTLVASCNLLRIARAPSLGRRSKPCEPSASYKL